MSVFRILRGQGKRFGFRVIMFFGTVEHIAEVGKIFKRADLAWKGEGGKKQKEFDAYVVELWERIGSRRWCCRKRVVDAGGVIS